MRVFTEAIKLAGDINGVLEKNGGRAADGGISLPFVGSMVALAGDGNHVDIGTLYGASAIMAVLIKKQLGLKGDVYAIDPYDPVTRAIQASPQLGMPGQLSATPEDLMKNVEEFGVADRFHLIQKRSDPWPDELKDTVFASAYIDGDHSGEMPWKDFLNLRGRVTNYIGFDNVEEEYSDVVAAVLKASDTEDWFLFYKSITFASIRRVLPARAASGQLMNVLQL